MSLSAMDMVFLVLLALLTLRGFLKGFTGEFISLASITLGLIGAVFFFRNGGAFLRAHYLSMPLLPEILSFISIFLIVFIAGKILEKILKDIIDKLNLEKLDKGLGLFLGLAKALALVSIILLVLSVQPLFDARNLLASSVFARVLLSLIGAASV
ncbi:MAG: CvpA family protein [Treponema sp.]|jgi:membrane protein required for colicin V production|nr:CvpA family protein [Treponema sp.]